MPENKAERDTQKDSNPNQAKATQVSSPSKHSCEGCYISVLLSCQLRRSNSLWRLPDQSKELPACAKYFRLHAPNRLSRGLFDIPRGP